MSWIVFTRRTGCGVFRTSPVKGCARCFVPIGTLSCSNEGNGYRAAELIGNASAPNIAVFVPGAGTNAKNFGGDAGELAGRLGDSAAVYAYLYDTPGEQQR